MSDPRAVDVTVDDASLVDQARAGDRTAFEALYNRHKLPLYRTALAITHEQGAAEELLQEAFLRAIRHMGRISLSPGASLRPWLHRIVINLAYDWSAKRHRSAAPFDGVIERMAVTQSLSPEREAEQRETERVVGDAVAQLPFKQRIVVILFYLHDMDLLEIAELLNVPEGTVKSRLYYARTNLRNLLETDVRLSVEGVLRYAPAQPPLA